MKHYLLPQGGHFYRANLHAHSTVSDGELTPKEVKDLYKSAGYSVLALADHNRLVRYPELCEDDFLMLPALEYDIVSRENSYSPAKKVYHINFYPEDPENVAMPCFHPMYQPKALTPPSVPQAYVGEPNYIRDYEKVNEVVSEFRKNGFIATLNHPTWSLQTIEDYRKLDVSQFFAMEIFNNASYLTEGRFEINTHLYDKLLREGNRIYCTATDDNHNFRAWMPRPHCTCGGFVMIKAERLDHRTIIEALKAGSFYASMGPLIEELYIEDNTLYVKTSPAAKIVLSTGYRCTRVVYPASPHASVCEATFDLSNIYPGYVRITVTDARGRMAWSQPYYKTEPIMIKS